MPIYLANLPLSNLDANVTVSSIADKYIAAVGGKDNLAKFNTLSSDATAKIQGMELIL